MTKHITKVVKLFLMLVVITFNNVYALPPAAPQITLEKHGLVAVLTWNNDDNATGYRVYYAPYTNPPEASSVIKSEDLGKTTQFSDTLESGSAGYYYGIIAYNADGVSELSNIEHAVFNNKVIAFLSSSEASQLRKAGLEEAFKEIQAAELEVIIVKDSKEIKDLFFGTQGTESQPAQRGYVDDPNVLAIVTESTDYVLSLTSAIVENPPLIIACTATSTLLDAKSNVLKLPANNGGQVEFVYDKLGEFVKTSKKMIKYGIVLTNRSSDTLYAYDLYTQFLAQSFPVETDLQETEGLEAGVVKDFAQLVGTLTLDDCDEESIATNPNSCDANVKSIATKLSILGAEVAFFAGSPSELKKLSTEHPNIPWVAFDNNYTYADFKGNNVIVLTLGGGDENYGYDAGGFLKAVLDPLDARLIDRSEILERAKDTSYVGRTGIITFSGSTGSYDMSIPGPDDWVKIP